MATPECDISEQEAEWLRSVTATFKDIAGEDNKISIQELQKALQIKESFFAERYFAYFDQDGSGEVELEEFTSSLQTMLKQTQEDKLRFMFDIFDENGDGTISRAELRVVISTCVTESDMKLTEAQLDSLVAVLLQAADQDGDGQISFEELKTQFTRYPSVVENLSISPSNWLKPPKPKKKPGIFDGVKKRASRQYIRNNMSRLVFIMIYILLNIALFGLNCGLYSDHNVYIILARGCGMCLNFNCALIVTFMLRRSLTWLRNTSLGNILPIDDSIELHKMVGYVITAFTIVHTVTHLGNIGTLTGTLAPGTTNHTLAYWEILFTHRAGVGWVADLAFITGVTLDLILLVMVVCSLHWVRGSGYFQVFYWSHFLYWAFWVLLIIHARNFCYWILLPGFIFLVEKSWNFLVWIQQGRSSKFYIEQVNLLHSKVTHLVISRPHDFHFTAGDYVFVKIPDLAAFEWHPFTISSAPEQEDVLWLHIRSLGTWTGKLHDFYKSGKYLENGNSAKVADVHSMQELGIEKMVKTAYDLLSVLGVPHLSTPGGLASTDKQLQSIKDHRKIFLSGPYGTPAHALGKTEHAVLVAGGIGVTPCASILQSLLMQHRRTKGAGFKGADMKLKKVDFVWVNRHVTDFEWFLMLLTQLEMEDAKENEFSRFLTIHLYLTSAKTKADMKGIGLQMALDLIHQQEERDLLTGLKTRMQPGRPDWNSLFRQLHQENHGDVHVFFCGSAVLAKVVEGHCHSWGFRFSHSF